jgi:hypothetical protein
MKLGCVSTSRRWLWSGAFDYRAHRIRIWNEQYERFGGATNIPLAFDRVTRDVVEKALGVYVNGVLSDVKTSVVQGDVVEPVVWDSDDGKKLLWHSSAHLMGDAIEQHFEQHVLLCDGPPLLQQGGFFYEFWSKKPPSTTDFASLNERMLASAQRKRKFESMTLPIEVARDMFSYNVFKVFFFFFSVCFILFH